MGSHHYDKTLWSLGDVAVILKFSNSSYRIIVRALAVKFVEGECHKNGNKPLPEPRLLPCGIPRLHWVNAWRIMNRFEQCIEARNFSKIKSRLYHTKGKFFSTIQWKSGSYFLAQLTRIYICIITCIEKYENISYKQTYTIALMSLQWRHNEHDGISNHQPYDCLLSRLFRHGPKKISKLHVTGLCEGYSPVTSEFPTQRASNVENVSIWWCHHILTSFIGTKSHCDITIPLIYWPLVMS